MFGIELLNQAGSSFLGKDATALLYWGYVDISFTANSTDTALYVPVFGLPTSVGASAFFHCNGTQPMQAVLTYGANNTWNVVVDGMNRTGSLRAYIFVEAKHINPPSWGLAVYSDTGVLKFHSGRPVLTIRQLGAGTGLGYKPASIGTMWKSVVNENPQSGTIFSTLYYDACLGTDAVYTNTVFTSSVYGRYAFEYVSKNIVVIDASYYETFPNLGNYPQ
jgi:hypothetical protein